jgi:hypothetical protein
MALGDPGDKPNEIRGNPPKSMLGGDNRTDLGRNVITKNAPKMPHDYDDKGDDPFCVPGSPSPDEVRSMFRGGGK